MQKKQILIISISLILLFVSSIPYRNYQADDFYISLQFAKNLSDLGEFSFNPGEPVYGFTSPIWIILLSLVERIYSNSAFIARILSTIFGLASILAFFLLARAVIPNETIAYGATLIWAYDPWFIRWVPSGMETSLALLLIFLCVFIYIKKGSFPLTCSLLAVATLTRPECVLLLILISADFLMRNSRNWKIFFKGITVYILLLTPWLLYSFFSFGSILPNTYKVKLGFPANLSNMVSSFSTGAKIVGSAYLIEIFFIFWLIGSKKRVILKKHLLLLSWILGVPLFLGLGGTMLVSRYLLLVLPFLILYGGLGLHIFLLSKLPTKRTQVFIFTGLLSVIFLGNSLLNWVVNYPSHQRYNKSFADSVIHIGKWFSENTPPNTSFMILRDFGAPGYFSQRKVYDCMGIITPEFISLWKQNPGHPLLRDVLYADLFRPDYVVDATKNPYLLSEDSSYEGLYKLLFTRGLAGRGQLKDTLYYTVYKVDWNRYNSF
jgi:hypothetical protein